MPRKEIGLKTATKRKLRSFRLSLRYKVALPVFVFLSMILFLQFRTTYRLVNSIVMERNESRLRAIVEVFAETVKVPLILRNQQVLRAHIEWMSKRSDVLEVLVEDVKGVALSTSTSPSILPEKVMQTDFLGAERITQDTYVVAAPIQVLNHRLGRVVILFSNKGFQEELRQIFAERVTLAFIMAVLLAIVTGGVTWLALRPLIVLKRTVQNILAGDLTARARIRSFDEIEDLAWAFNEVVARLAKSLDNLRSRTEALEESENKYRLIVENASDVIFVLTAQGEVALLNKGFSGCTRDELLREGLPLFLSLHSEESRKKFLGALETVQERKEVAANVATTHLHRTNRTEIFYLTNLTPVMDHEGQVKLIQGVMRDVTELRRIEMMKDSLIRDVAHELKTPTAKFEMVVNWFEKDIEKRKDGERYAEILGILKNNTDRLSRTITSIMDLSKLESGVVEVSKTDLDLNDVLNQVHQDMEPIAQQKKLNLECVLYSGSLMMKGDRDMLYRLFVNLIGNAIKFTESGKITVKSFREENQILVEVNDAGLGIEKGDLEIIFQRFVQKTASTAGIGVGLAISRQIATLHGGKIWAESGGPGKGATFKVQFPVVPTHNL